MPTVTRFLRNILIIGLVLFGAVYALANFVAPKRHPISIPVDSDVLQSAEQPAG